MQRLRPGSTLQFKFLNKTAIIGGADKIKPDGTRTKRWNLCSIQQVEEAKCLIRIIPIWLSGMMFLILSYEISNFTVLQSLTMDRHIGRHFQIPPGSVLTIIYLALALFALVYDQILVPLLTKLTNVEGGITVLQRQGAGIAVASIAFAVAALVEHKRRDSALAHGGMSPLTVFWLMPWLVLSGIAWAFNVIGQIELYNTQFPKQMVALGNAAFYGAQGDQLGCHDRQSHQ